MIAMEPNNEDNFLAYAYHKETKKVWAIDAFGNIEQSAAKSPKDRSWQGSEEKEPEKVKWINNEKRLQVSTFEKG